MVPLIDTFFLMLAFFISSVLSMEVVRGLPVELPSALGASSLAKENRLLVTLKVNGSLELEGEPIALEDLRRRLVLSTREGTVQVGIRADRQVPYERVIEVLSAIRESGIARVTLLTAPAHPEKRLPR